MPTPNDKTEAQKAAERQKAEESRDTRTAQQRAAAQEAERLRDTPEQREEMRGQVEPAVAEALQVLGADPPRPLREQIAEHVAQHVTPGETEVGEAGDMTRLLAMEIREVYKRHGMEPPGTIGQMEQTLEALAGERVVRPEGILTIEQEIARQEEVRAKTEQMLAAPNTKRARYLQDLKDSPPCEFFAPNAQTFQVNGVTIRVPQGRIAAKRKGEMPRAGALGCEMVRDLVYDAQGARLMEQRAQELYKNFQFISKEEMVARDVDKVDQGGVF
jgi:hypothetical protein